MKMFLWSFVLFLNVSFADNTTKVETIIMDNQDQDKIDTSRESLQKPEKKIIKKYKDDSRQEEQAIRDDPFIDNYGNGLTTNKNFE